MVYKHDHKLLLSGGIMNEKRTFYGHPVDPSLDLTLTEQIHLILAEEIHAGRWEVGDRLPSIADLVEMSGVGRVTMLRALDMLQKEGYIRTEGPRGTFLASILPEGRISSGTIGILLPVEDPWRSFSEKESWSLRYLHQIQEAAAERNYKTEVLVLPNDADCSRIDTTEGSFGDRVKGIISLLPFPRENPTQLSPDMIPIVFALNYIENCMPSVTLDSFAAHYKLTLTALRKGHRRILYFCGTPQISSVELHRRFEGYSAAMAQAGLSPDREAFEESKGYRDHDNSESYCEFFRNHSDATAIVCTTGQNAVNLVKAAQSLDLRIPQDLSILAHGPQKSRYSIPDIKIAGIGAHFSKIVSICFELLTEQERTKENRFDYVLVNAPLDEGNTLASPRSEAEKVATGAGVEAKA